MALVDHLRELRARLLKSRSILVVWSFVVALFFYDQLFELILDPYDEAQETLRRAVQTEAVRSAASPAG